MIRSLLPVALLALALSAVAQPTANSLPQWERPERAPIDVQVVDGQVQVPESVAFTTEAQGVLVWRLVTPGYSFPGDGIVIDAVSVFRCQALAGGRLFRCLKLRHVPAARYKYDVNVIRDNGGQRLPVLDPWIQNS